MSIEYSVTTETFIKKVQKLREDQNKESSKT